MTSKEQQLLIAAIRLAYEQDANTVDYHLGVQFTAQAIAQALVKANPQFDSVKFLTLCGLNKVN